MSQIIFVILTTVLFNNFFFQGHRKQKNKKVCFSFFPFSYFCINSQLVQNACLLLDVTESAPQEFTSGHVRSQYRHFNSRQGGKTFVCEIGPLSNQVKGVLMKVGQSLEIYLGILYLSTVRRVSLLMNINGVQGGWYFILHLKVLNVK